MMSSGKGQSKAKTEEQKPRAEQSPSEKLRTETPIGSQAPGAESPTSEGIKKEVNPNTE